MTDTLRHRFREWPRRYGPILAVVLVVLLVLIALLAKRIFHTLDSGQVGVQWSRFRGGTITDRVYGEGMHVIVPWNTMTKYSVRYQRITHDLEAIAKGGLALQVQVVVRYRPKREDVPSIHKYLGPDYVNVLIRPEIEAHAREAIAAVAPQELYSDKRLHTQNLVAKKLELRTGIHLQQAMLDAAVLGAAEREGREDDDTDDKKDRERKRRKKATKDFRKDADQNLVQIEDVLIQDIRLPTEVAAAIEDKLRQEQLMLEYEYRVQRAEKEKRRKTIESEGIAEFRRTAGVSIAKWKALDATLQLAASTEAKLVIIGSAEEAGLPLILGPLAAAEPTIGPSSVPPQ